MSSYGGWIETPHLDKLAAQGMKFTDFHSSGNVCSPTRAGLMTGRYQQRAGIPGVVFADPTNAVHYHGLQTSEVTFAELLRGAGYSTAIFGKWHLGYYPKYNPIQHGFDSFRGYVSGNVDFISHVDQAGVYDWWHQDKHVVEEGYTTHLITTHAIEFIEANKRKPFCLYLPHEAPHYPYQGPNDPALRSVGGAFDNQGERKDIKNAYREMVQEMDKGVGEVVETIERLGLAENTLVLFFSDNGANKNGDNGPLRGAKGSNWEGGHRVPCIARWTNRITPGTFRDDLTISLDVMPTLLAAAGVAIPDNHKLDGVNLLPVMLDKERLGTRQLVWNGKAIRDGGWKLVVDGKGGERVGLYDLSVDLGEQKNLADAEPNRVKTMLARLEAWKADVASGESLQPRETSEEQASKASASTPKKRQKKKP
ncbi:MAG: sulfatase-like hydrolase/transferase [Planctomycetota bacterium]|nr:sulfatase-like hydrolase/transferase [Planctomycetota bacterium]